MALARKLKTPASAPSCPPTPSSPPPCPETTDRIAKLINDHPFPGRPLRPLLERHLRPPLLSPALLEAVLARLFCGHANGLKSLELFRFSLRLPGLRPTPRAFDTALHALARMRHFDGAWELLEEVRAEHPSLLTRKSLGIVLSKYAQFRSFQETMDAFDRMEKRVFAGREFGADEFNVLLKAFCAQKQVMEVRAVFRRLHSRFPPNTRTLNTLLLGFKETGNVMALDSFYHEMILRGFSPDVVSFNIRIDAYCKKGRILDALQLFEEMEKRNCLPTVQTLTTLVHGATIARNPSLARRLFDDMSERNLIPDTGAYNAFMTSLVRTKDLKSAMELMHEMEAKGVEHNDVTYCTMFWGLQKYGGVKSVCKLYREMVGKNFVPKVRTVVTLMKFFCENRRADLGLDLWSYMVGKGCCPHGHALDLLATALCCGGKVDEAYNCFKQVMERGRCPTERSFRVMEGSLVQGGEAKKLEELKMMMLRLQNVGLPSLEQAFGCSSESALV
uniref:Pentatricopeptide repeat-containing protein At3g61360 n=1 Tax=Anthurium amnicola TaxID=1678845 RepID=A0A1D1YU34_9ARAE